VKLKIFLPSELFLNEEVSKVVGEGPSGSFCILPRHIDYVTALVPGILTYQTTRGEEQFLAVNKGILIKMGDQVLVSSRLAVKGELGQLQVEVKRMISKADKKEKMTQSACARLEANLVRRFVEFGKNG